jgi:hypothetical protein
VGKAAAEVRAGRSRGVKGNLGFREPQLMLEHVTLDETLASIR